MYVCFKEILSKGNEMQNDTLKAVENLIHKWVTIAPMEKTSQLPSGRIKQAQKKILENILRKTGDYVWSTQRVWAPDYNHPHFLNTFLFSYHYNSENVA